METASVSGMLTLQSLVWEKMLLTPKLLYKPTDFGRQHGETLTRIHSLSVPCKQLYQVQKCLFSEWKPSLLDPHKTANDISREIYKQIKVFKGLFIFFYLDMLKLAQQ